MKVLAILLLLGSGKVDKNLSIKAKLTDNRFIHFPTPGKGFEGWGNTNSKAVNDNF